MSERAHIIDIDSIVLNGVETTRLDHAGVLLEAQLVLALAGVRADIVSKGALGQRRVAREVARAVMGALPGAPNGT